MPNLEINIATTADTSGAVQARTAVKELTGEVRTGSGETENYREKTQQLREGMHMISLLTGGEVREGFHETGLGLKLLGSLTGSMSMGIFEIAAAAGVALPMIVGFFKEAHEKVAEEMKKMQDEIDENIKKIEQTVSEAKLERLHDMATDMKDAKDSAEKLTQEFPKTMKAEAEFATAALVNEGLLATAQHNIAVALGQQVNAVRELEQAEELASKKRELAMLQEIKTQEEQLKEARKRKASAEADALLVEEDIERTKVALDRSKAALADAEAKKREAQGALITPAPGREPGQHGGSLFGSDARREWNENREEAEQTLKDPRTDKRIEVAEKEAKTLEGDLKKLEREKEKDETAVGVAQNVIEDESSSIAENLEKLKTNFASQELVGKSKELLDIEKANSEQFKDVLGKVTVTVGASSAAYDDAERILAKGEIDAKNLPKAISDVGKLIAALQAHAVGMSGNYDENLRQMLTLQANLNEQANVQKRVLVAQQQTNLTVADSAARIAVLEAQIKLTREQMAHQ